MADARNADVLIGVRDWVKDTFEMTWRPEAKVSVFDAGFVLGDGVWEGIRLHRGVLLFAHEHIRRLYQGAKAGVVPSPTLFIFYFIFFPRSSEGVVNVMVYTRASYGRVSVVERW